MTTEEKKFKKIMKKNISPKKNLRIIKKNIDFKKEQTIMNKKIILGITGGCLAIATAVVVMVSYNKANINQISEPKTLVNIDVNPSVELTLDKNNKVVSVKGLNDEGSLIIYGELLVGKNLEDAVEVIIKVETETGYLLKGNIDASENNINISILTDEDSKKEFEDKIITYIENACDKYGVTETINRFEKYTRDELIEKIKRINPSLSDEKLDNMTIEEMLKYIAAYHVETSEIYSEKLEELYYQAKENKINIIETEAVNNVLDDVNSLYQSMVKAYSEVCDSLQNYYVELEDLTYNLFVDSNSDYQKCLKKMYDSKNEVIKLKNKIASSDEASSNLQILQQLLQNAEDNLNNQITLLEGYASTGSALVETYRDSIKQILNSLQEIQKLFPTEIKTKINEQLSKIEDKVNNAKDEFFEEFEKKYEQNFKQFEKEISDRKEKLIADLK